MHLLKNTICILLAILLNSQVHSQNNLKLDLALGGAIDISKNDFVAHQYNSIYYRSSQEITSESSILAYPEPSIYLEYKETSGIKIAISQASYLSNEEKFIRPNVTVYFRELAPHKKSNLSFGLSYDFLKTTEKIGAEQTDLTHHSKGLFIGLFLKKLRAELHFNHYNRRGYRSCFCNFNAVYPRFGFTFRLNYTILSTHKTNS